MFLSCASKGIISSDGYSSAGGFGSSLSMPSDNLMQTLGQNTADDNNQMDAMTDSLVNMMGNGGSLGGSPTAIPAPK